MSHKKTLKIRYYNIHMTFRIESKKFPHLNERGHAEEDSGFLKALYPHRLACNLHCKSL